FVRIVESHNPGAALRNDRLWNRQHVAKALVEARGDVTGELDVLLLIGADRHPQGAGRAPSVEKDIGSLQHRVIEETDAGSLALHTGFFFELRHALEPAERRQTVEDPA